MPEYEKVYIPPQHVSEFELKIRELGGHFNLKRKTRDEDQKELITKWIKAAEPARQRLAQFAEPHENPAVQASIDSGVLDLLVRSTSANPKIIVDNLYTLRHVLVDKFRADLPEDVPAYMRLLPSPKGNVLSLNASDPGQAGRLSPKAIVFLIDKFGLADGQRRTSLQIAREFGISPHGVEVAMGNGLHRLRGWFRSGKNIV